MKSAIFKNLRATFLLATFIVCVGYGVLFYTIRQSNIVIASASVSSEARAKQINTADSLKKTLENSATEISLLSKYFISSEGPVSFIEYLEDLGESVGAVILIQDVKEVENFSGSSQKSELTFRIIAQGSWRSVYRFLALLENSPHTIVISNVELRKSSVNESVVLNAFQSPKDSESKAITGAWRGDFEFTVLKNK